MIDARLAQNSFNGGIWSPILVGRTDFAKHGSAVRRMENFIVWPHGPAEYRPGFKYIAKADSDWVNARLIPFEFSVTQAYIIEAGHKYFRFYKDQAQIEASAGVPYEVVTPYEYGDLPELKWCQSADVLYLFHPDYATRKLSRTAHDAWTLQEITWAPGPMSVQAYLPAATLTLSAVSGADVTFTASASVFLGGDVGRLIVSGIGRASIVSVTSGTVVVCNIFDSFLAVGPIASGSWSMKGSPYAELTPSIIEPVGGICTLTAGAALSGQISIQHYQASWWTASGSGTNEYYLLDSADPYYATEPDDVYINGVAATSGTVGSLVGVGGGGGDNDTLGYDTIYVRLFGFTDPDLVAVLDGYLKREDATVLPDVFRSGDVGKLVRINSGLVRITNYLSSRSVEGEIITVLTTLDLSTDWTLETLMWSAANGYPRDGTFFEERLILAGSDGFPETVWGSVVGDYENHAPGINDSDAIQVTIIGQKVNIIRWVEPGEYLIVGTTGGEWRVGPEDTGTAMTPLNIVAKQTTSKGCADIPPITVDGSTLFVQRVARKIRELTFDFAKGERGGYSAPDLTQLAEHLTVGGITSFAYQQEPFSTIWCAVEGRNLIGLTYLRSEDVIGWHEHPMTGTDEVEDVAVIPGTDYDEVWCVIKRTVAAATVRYVECMQKVFTDTAAEYKANKGLNAFFVDSGETYNGVETSTITDLERLAGEEVSILADGAYQENQTVNDQGEIDLDPAASVVHIGLPYTGLIQTLRIDTQLPDGTAQAKEKQITNLFVRVKDSAVFKCGRDEDNLDTIQDPDITLVDGDPYPLFSGDLDARYEGEYGKKGQLFIVQDKPMPLTIQSVYPDTEII